MKTQPFNIVLLPSWVFAAKAMRVSHMLRAHGGLFTLDGRRRHAHLTIYQVELPVKNLRQAVGVLKEIAVATRPIRLHTARFRQGPAGFVDVAFRCTAALKDLQRQVVRAINPLREGALLKDDRGSLRGMTALERTNIQRFGFVAVGARYYPHITFTKFKTYAPGALRDIPRLDFNGTSGVIALFTLGPFGTCNKLVKKFKLS